MTETPKSDIQRLLATLPQTGVVQWIGVRPKRLADLLVLDSVHADMDDGLEGDRANGGKSKKRQVSLIQAEHLELVSAVMKHEVLPEMVRRNIVVSGINLLSLKSKSFQIGDAVFLGTGLCAPCSRMETNLGPGGYNAMLGHGGITAKIIRSGTVAVGDSVRAVEAVGGWRLAVGGFSFNR